MKRRKLFLFIALLLASLPIALNAEVRTWSFEWNTSKLNGGSGFYNFGTSAVDKDFYTATLNDVVWNIASDGTKTYAFTASAGQNIGKASEPSTHTSMWTSAIVGKIKAVRISTRTSKAGNTASVSVNVNNAKYLCNSKESAELSNTLAEYAFTPTDAGNEGKIEINIDPTSDAKGVLYIKKVEVDYEVAASSVPEPVFTPVAGTYDAAQTVSMTCSNHAAGTYTIYYTTDGSNPRIDGTRKTYTDPISISSSTELKACVLIGDEYSNVATAKYVIRKDANISFNKAFIELTSGDDGYADLLNPNKVEPITYKSSAWNVCSVDEKGSLSTSYVTKDTEVTISAIFAGNETFKPATAEMKVLVKAKTPLKTPVVSPAGGTFTEPVTVTISTDDANAVTIWYSTTATSQEEFEDDYTKSTVVEDKTTSFTIDKSCRLYVMTRGYNQNSAVVTADFNMNIPLKADFTTDKAVKEIYVQGFESQDEASTWTVGKGWTLANKGFSEINSNDKYSAFISYEGSGITELTSPDIDIPEKSSVEFYANFAGGFLVYGSWQFNIVDEDGTIIELMDAFKWAQQNAYTGPSWNKFSFDLAEYAGKKVKFQFMYTFGGEDLALDGFRIVQTDNASVTKINIFEEESIQYTSMAQGEPESVEWTFEGGTPATSTEENPLVTYNTAGIYKVSFTVRRGDQQASSTRENYVEVSKRSPEAHIGLPEEGYESPFVGVFVPTGVPVTFRDLSTNKPTEWTWKFQNTDIEDSNEQNPTVTYTKKGVTSVGLIAKNQAGSSQDMLAYAIQAGGAQYVWNIGIEENQNIEKIDMGFSGSYAGSNYLGIERFAEKYKAPLAKAQIDSVAVYFASATTVSPDADIIMTINKVSDNGTPGDVMATTSLKASQLRYEADSVVATIFKFPETINLEKGQQFFICIGPFPNTSMETSPYTSDDIAIFCVRRGAGKKCTAWHYMEDQDTQGNSLGTKSWYENTDDPLSMAIAPVISYELNATGIENVAQAAVPFDKHIESIYTIAGQRVNNTNAHGIYIIKYTDGSTVKVRR